MSEVISKLETNEELQQQAKVIYDCGNTLLVLIEELLDVAQLDAGSIILEHIPFDVRQTLRDSVNLIHSKAQQKNLKIQLHTAPLLPQYLIGDAQRLRQVILNLLMNAVKFTEHGEIIVHTKIIEDNQETITFQINVTDSGVGISGEKQQLLFKYFSQIDNVSSRNYSGAGIGLFICHKIISLMKGQIGVVSELHQGSTFWIQLTLPVAIPKKSFEKFAIQRRIISQQAKNILVIEDDLTTQKFMKIMLEKVGLKVDAANNGKIALELIEKNQYDLILLDIIMPIMDGYTTAKTLRNNITLKDLPIIAVSSLDPEKEQEKIKAVGISDYLSKPVTPTSLNKMLKKWLK
jgi:CheY-like chemotaxis protein